MKNRTIKYVADLDPAKKSELISAICTGTLRGVVTVYHWLNERRRPCFLEMKFIQEKVKEIYGMEIPLTELFPVRK